MWAVYAKIKNENAVDEKDVSKFSKAYGAIFKENDDNFFGAEVRTDVQALGSLGMQESNEKEEVWRSIFVEVTYDKELSVYRLWWSPLMIEHVKNTQPNYIQQDLQVSAHFKNTYSFDTTTSNQIFGSGNGEYREKN